MDQLSFVVDCPAFPLTYEDLQTIYNNFIFEGEKDEDAFTWAEIKNGRSYFMYGKKVFEFIPGNIKKARIRIFPLDKDSKPETLTPDSSPTALFDALSRLKEMKRIIFRATITEEFACCNDFVKCSDAKQCLYPQDRFYNGCYYRKNLEAGRIFYGKNQNIE